MHLKLQHPLFSFVSLWIYLSVELIQGTKENQRHLSGMSGILANMKRAVLHSCSSFLLYVLCDPVSQRHYLKEFYSPFWCMHQAIKAGNTSMLNLSAFFPNIQLAGRITLFIPVQHESNASNTHMTLVFLCLLHGLTLKKKKNPKKNNSIKNVCSQPATEIHIQG